MERTTTRVLYCSRSFVLGEFRCAPDDPKWVRRSSASVPFMAIPRTCSVITQAGRGTVVATPNEAIFYNAECEYTCRILSPARELTTYVDFTPEVLIEAIRRHDPTVESRPRAPLDVVACTTRATTYFLYAALSTAGPAGSPDPIRVEEQICLGLDAVLADAYASRRRPVRAARPGGPAPQDYARHVQEFLATRFREPVSLESVASGVGVSTFHLCRVFREAMGTTIHAYLNALRLRTSVEELADERRSLTSVALGLGFCNQSHFTAAFRRHFGTSPGRVRRGLKRLGVRRSRRSLLD